MNNAINSILTKEQFVSAINDVKSVYKYHNSLNSFFRKNNVDGYIFQPDCATTVLTLLKNIFNDKDETISYFCFELEFGENYTKGCFTDNGNDISLSTAEELYDYLCCCM